MLFEVYSELLMPIHLHLVGLPQFYSDLFCHQVEMRHRAHVHIVQHSAVTQVWSLRLEFLHYLNFGGYPEVVLSEKIQSDMGRYVKNDIVDKVLLRDLPSLYGIKDVQELNRFFTYVAYNTGNEFSYESMSKELVFKKKRWRNTWNI